MGAEIVRFVERLNLAHHESSVGAYFPEIVALMSLVFGLAFLLFAWRHHEYFLGITGFLVGGWAGLLLKSHLAPGGEVAPVLYLAVCSVAGAFLAVAWRRFTGMLLGGFSVACLGTVLFPMMFEPGQDALATVCLAFLLGGGLGGIFPKLFFIFNSSLIGSIFATYGLSLAIVRPIFGATPPHLQGVVHLLIFLPCLLFGVAYQFITSQGQPMSAPAPRPA